MGNGGPLSPEEFDRQAMISYYQNLKGVPGENMTATPKEAVSSTAASYYGAPPPPPLDLAQQIPPMEPGEAIRMMSTRPTSAPAPQAQTIPVDPTPAPQPGAEALPPGLRSRLTGALGEPPSAAPAGGLPEYSGGKIAGIAPKNPAEAQASFAAKGAAAEAEANRPVPVQMKEQTVQGSPARPADGGGYVGDGGAARRDLYSTFPAEKIAMQRLADAEEARSEAMAAGMAVIGADRVREAALQETRAAHEREIMRVYQEDTQRQLDEVRSQTVDPNRLYSDGGSKALAIIGGVLGGIYQGMNKLQSNPFIDQMNRNIDRDIALQEHQLDRNTKAVGERKGILADMRMTYKDEDLARTQAKNLYYEGIKQQLAAQAAQYESPAIQARADQAINIVDRQQAALKLDEQAKRAAAAAAAGALARAEKWREAEFALKQEEAITHRITANRSGVGHKEGQSPRERFVGVAQDEHGNPTGYLARNATEASKAAGQLASTRELITLAEKAKQIRADEGMLGRATWRDNPIYSPTWHTNIKSIENQLVGAIKKSEELGALDNGVERFAKPLTGNLDSIGGSADDRLDMLIEAAKTKMSVHTNQLSGQQAVMLPGEEVVQTGGANAPKNLKGSTGVNREP